MRTMMAGVFAFALAVGSAATAVAACGDDPNDAAQVAAARAAVDGTCDCSGSATHGAYVSCAAGVVNQRVTDGLLRSQCKGSVKRCASRSTCGKPGFVTCCRTKATGATRCSTKRDDAHCTPPDGGSACVGQVPSCCDACTGSGCAGSPSGAFVSDPATF